MFWSVWHAFAALLVAVLPAVLLFQPPWHLSASDAVPILLLLLGYPLGALAIHWTQWRRQTLSVGAAGAIALAAFVPPLLLLESRGADLPLALTTAVVLLSAVLLAAPLAVEGRNRSVLLVSLCIAGPLAVLTAGAVTDSWRLEPKASVARHTSATSLYDLRTEFFRGYVPRSYSGVAGGGIVPLQDGGLLVTGDGDAYRYTWVADGVAVEALPIAPPMNREDLIEKTGTTGWIHWFRVLDVALRWIEDRPQLFVTHHYWRDQSGCFVLRVSMLELNSDDSFSSPGSARWQTIHETEPCLHLQTATDAGWPFRGMEGGGRMAFLGRDQMLVTIGDHGFNGVDFETDLVNEPEASYGKTIVVNLDASGWETLTTGHRNAQGLAVGPDGSTWISEHGPAGGDELNLLQPGEHFGWPQVTYGTDYGRRVWPLNPRQGRHEGFIRPAFSWVPSVGISALEVVDSPLFTFWSGDIIAGSLIGRHLYRIRLVDGAAQFAEPITIGEPVRDFHFDHKGRLILWTDRYSLVRIAPETLAFASCSGCHNVGDGSQHRIGPDLAGLFSRPIGGAEDYNYSQALRDLDGEWTNERLDEYLEDPQAFAPGTTMRFEGVPDPAVRQALIEYLQQWRRQ